MGARTCCEKVKSLSQLRAVGNPIPHTHTLSLLKARK